MSLRLLALVAVSSLLVACDSSDEPSDSSLLRVTARTASGAPAVGLDVFVTYGRLLPSDDTVTGDDATFRGGDFRVGQPSPNPARRSSSYSYEIPVTGPVLIRLLDVAGTERAVLRDETVEAGFYQGDIDFDGFAAGVYQIEVTYGGETITRDVLKSDAADEGQSGLAIFLGRTDADGRLATSDSTHFPALYRGSQSYLVTDDQGSPLGTFLIDRTVGVVVQSESGESDGTQVFLNGRGTEATLRLAP